MLRDLINNHTPLKSNFERLSTLFQCAINAYKYPLNGNHLSQLGELSGYYCVEDIHKRMLQHPIGQRILKDKPRVTPETFKIEDLLKLDDNTFGHQYGRFMKERDFSSGERPIVKYIPNLELAYVYQRYKEIHDFIHVLLMYDVSVYDEIVVKWYEMAQLGLPSATLSAFVGSFKLNCQEKQKLIETLPDIIKRANQSEFIMNVYFEEHINTDITQLRKSLRLL
ncbi:unnamed protein product [Paramecium sonneborni]|uniref:Ubiquinone biosynthesis protein COQ4 homolog, mitochondrial n=1 Tax=Paramecium sonneborni TaxID=65129 RepID=A0A8S1Q7B0_9CILI|nr:unnamed protein product [Paramecium sonneborni]